MTAQVAVMNNLAVALATDSAATARYGNNTKIYNSANKLFTLTKVAPVGAMVYGSAGVDLVPWELVIKSYRHSLGKTRYSHLDDYADGLTRFIQADTRLFPSSLQEHCLSGLVQSYLSYLRESIVSRVKKAFDKKDSLSEDEIRQLADSCIVEEETRLGELSKLPCIDDEVEGLLLAKCLSLVNKHLADALDALASNPLSPERLANMCLRVITCDAFNHPIMQGWSSGLVIAGFGDDDMFPRLVEVEVSGVFEGALVHKVASRHEVSATSGPVIRPFAQGEMVRSFMEGIEPDVRSIFEVYLKDLLPRLADLVAERTLGSPSADPLSQSQSLDMDLRQILDSVRQGIDAYIRRAHVNPVLAAVAALPKDELAAMAESLVTLTSLKRRVSTSAETVGGPVDVAVISKGDGFIWIKRKHYFEPSLNPAFFATYLMDLDQEG